LGYNEEGHNFCGPDWTVQVAKVANETGIIDGIKGVDFNEAITREVAAQMIFNVLFTDTVNWTLAFGYKNAIGEDDLATDIFGIDTDKDGKAANDDWGRPATEWYDYDVKDVDDQVIVSIPEAALATYTVKVSDCQIAVDMDLEEDANVVVYDNGVKGSTFIDLTETAKNNGAQGTLVEVYEDCIVVIDTYLAQVTDVKEAKYDAAGHVTAKAATTLNVFGHTTYNGTVETTKYADDAYVLVNYNEATDELVILQAAESFVGTQTAQFINSAKHEVNDTVYNDAAHYHMTVAAYDTAKYTWFLDQYGNLIGDAEIEDVYAYGVIKSIQWINPEDEDGYAKAVIVDMFGNESVKKIASIDGKTATYDDGPEIGVTAGISDNLSDNYALYAGKHLYQIKETEDGAELTQVKQLNDADVATSIPEINGEDTKDQAKEILVDNKTQYLVQVTTDKVGVYTFEAVTGYANIGDYSNCTVDYVYVDKDSIVDLVYIIGEPDAIFAHDFIFIANADDIKVTLQTKGGVDYYVVSGIVRGDGSTDPLYIIDNVGDGKFKDDIVNWVEDSVGKLFKVSTVDGYVGAIFEEIVEVINWTELPNEQFAVYCGAVTVIGDGMIDTEYFGTWNTNASTTYITEDGVVSKSALTEGDFIYVIGDEEGGDYQANVIFITDVDVIGDIEAAELAAAKAEAVEALNDYAAAAAAANGVEVADIQAALDAQIAAVNALTDVEAVEAFVNTEAPYSASVIAIWEAAVAAGEAQDAAAAKAAFDATVAKVKAWKASADMADPTAANVAAQVEAIMASDAFKTAIADLTGYTYDVTTVAPYTAPSAVGNTVIADVEITLTQGDYTATFVLPVTVSKI
ncbi:MAG: hypothetical protein J6K94_04265, partial [Ruminiclostridium sp.]|nr:hypothetical protein [Ruminiclostridium sp.]